MHDVTSLLFSFSLCKTVLDALGQKFVVAFGFDFPSKHHRVIFVDHVVAVHWVAAVEVAEAEEELDALVRLQARHVFA
jgi:hypothetical protein